jgi:hypothetical protein
MDGHSPFVTPDHAKARGGQKPGVAMTAMRRLKRARRHGGSRERLADSQRH